MSSTTSYICKLTAPFRSEMMTDILSRFLKKKDSQGREFGESESQISYPTEETLRRRPVWSDSTRHLRTEWEQKHWPKNMLERIKFEIEIFVDEDPVEFKEVMCELSKDFMMKHYDSPEYREEPEYEKKETYIVAVYIMEKELDADGNPVLDEEGRPKLRKVIDPVSGKPKEGIRTITYNWDIWKQAAKDIFQNREERSREIVESVGEPPHVKAVRSFAEDLQKHADVVCNEKHKQAWVEKTKANPTSIIQRAKQRIESDGSVRVTRVTGASFKPLGAMTKGSLDELLESEGPTNVQIGGRLTLRCKTKRKIRS